MENILKKNFVSFRRRSCAVVLMYVVSVVVCVLSPLRLRRRLRITSVVVCASPPSSFAHRLRRRLRIASVVVCASPPHHLWSVLICASPLHCLRSVFVTTSSPSTMMSSPRSFHFFLMLLNLNMWFISAQITHVWGFFSLVLQSV